MNEKIQNQKSPMYISFCTQKGGAGKSVFTILAASYLHYQMGYSVAVIDCDFPQWSVQKMRERETCQIQNNNYYKKKAYDFFTKTDIKAFPVVPSKPESALADAKKFLEETDKQFDLVLFDLPGTVNNRDVVNIIINMDYLFVPLSVSRINLESTLNFVANINAVLQNDRSGIKLKHVYTFWNRMMANAKKELYEAYDNAMRELEISIMQTRIPQSVRYDREQSISDADAVFLSTFFMSDKSLLKGSNWEEFMVEFLELTNLKTK
ncbi:MAG: AAA family ATPase [Candidatus Azobacteroides sp.]|nr:AAA family ATPase [Candidatus Azobacteroides sp.]